MYVMKPNLELKKSNVLIHGTTRASSNIIMLSEEARHESPPVTYFYLHELFGIGKSIVTEGRLLVAKG